MKLIIFTILLFSLTGLLLSPTAFASHGESGHEETHSQGHKKTIYVNSELSHCVGVSPQKCMQIRDSAESNWEHFYDKIHGFTHESGFDYRLEVLITDVENPPADASSKKYELVQILSKNPTKHFGNMDNSMGQHGMKNKMMGNPHLSYKGMCAAGFASLDGICVLDDRCGAGAYAGRVCVMDGVMKQYLKPLHQKHAGISAENIICTEGTELMFKHHNGTPACIKVKSVEKLKHRGWQTEMPPIACTMEYNPVCGVDGVTYGNMCGLNAQHMAMSHHSECVSSELIVEQIHQGYSDTAPQYEVNGKIISNVDTTAPLWNPRGKTMDQIEERAYFLASKYDLTLTDAQQERADKARDKYSNSIVINALMPSSVGIGGNTAENFEKALKRNLDAGITMMSATIFAYPGDSPIPVLQRLDDSKEVMGKFGIEVVTNTDSIRQAKADRTIIVMFNNQGSDYLIDNQSMLEKVKNEGVHVSNFVYNKNNELAGGGTEQNMGLTELGQEFVKQSNALGMIIDCTHSSTQTCIDAAKYTQKPMIASHSNAYELHPVTRNIHDEGLNAIASTGGVVCNTGVGMYLNDELDSSPEALAIHVEYVGNLIGRDKTCFSTDYTHNYLEYTMGFVPNVDVYPPESGFGAPTSNIAPEHVWSVAAVLEDKYNWTDDEVQGFLGENLMRVYDANWN